MFWKYIFLFEQREFFSGRITNQKVLVFDHHKRSINCHILPIKDIFFLDSVYRYRIFVCQTDFYHFHELSVKCNMNHPYLVEI